MRPLPLLIAALLVACSKDEEAAPQSSPTDPTVDWTDTDTDTDADTDTDTDADADTDTDADADTDTDTDTGNDTGVAIEPLEIIGSYGDAWGGVHEITGESWTMTYAASDTGSADSVSVFAIASYDNEAEYLVAQNDAANEWNPGLWSRFDWTTDTSGGLYYCQIAYDAASAEDAAAVDTADHADVEAGCNGFAWTALTPLDTAR